MEKLKIILIAGSMPNFSDEGPRLYRKYQEDLQKLSGELGFDLTVYRELIFTEKKAMKVRKEIEDVLAEAERIDESLVKREYERVTHSCVKIIVNSVKIIDSIKNYLAVKKICEENNFKAVAFSCWPKLQSVNITGCLTESLLDSLGIPAGCWEVYRRILLLA